MKIYINNYNIDNLSKKLKGLNEYLINKTNSIEIYSDEGIYLVDENNIYNITYLDRPVQKINYTDDVEMCIDLSTTNSIIVNQLPSDNIILKLATYTYKLCPRSKVKLIVNFTLNKNMEYKPYNFYFDVSDDIDINGPIFKEDINVFLFHLN
jgi:hypothetical protein